MPPSWPSLKCTVSRHYKWRVSKACQPWWRFYDTWEEGAANHRVAVRHSSQFRSLTWIKLFEPWMHRVMCHLIKKSLTFCNFFQTLWTRISFLRLIREIGKAPHSVTKASSRTWLRDQCLSDLCFVCCAQSDSPAFQRSVFFVFEVKIFLVDALRQGGKWKLQLSGSILFCICLQTDA